MPHQLYDNRNRDVVLIIAHDKTAGKLTLSCATSKQLIHAVKNLPSGYKITKTIYLTAELRKRMKFTMKHTNMFSRENKNRKGSIKLRKKV